MSDAEAPTTEMAGPTCSVATAADAVVVEHATIPQTRTLAQPIRVSTDNGGANEPICVGFRSDIPIGDRLTAFDPILLGRPRVASPGPLELIASDVRGLPVGTEENVRGAYLDLLDDGCMIASDSGPRAVSLIKDHPGGAGSVPRRR